MQRIWMRAFMRVRLAGFRPGDPVYVKPTGLIHKSVGKTYWLTDGRSKLMHVAEEAYGRNLSQLIQYAGEVKRQSALDKATQPLLVDSQFGPERAHQVRKLIKRSKDRR
jgi:hypothetical protein